MDTLIVLAIVGWAVFYLLRRYRRILRPAPDNACDCGCSGCGQGPDCPSEAKSIQPKS